LPGAETSCESDRFFLALDPLRTDTATGSHPTAAAFVVFISRTPRYGCANSQQFRGSMTADSPKTDRVAAQRDDARTPPASKSVDRPAAPELRALLHSFWRSRAFDFASSVIPAAFFFWFMLEECLNFWIGLQQPALYALDPKTVAVVVASFSKIVFLSLVVTLFLIRRSPLEKAAGLLPRIAALAGTFMMLLVVLLPTSAPSLTRSLVGVTLVAVGSILSAISVASLGKSFSIMAEARELVTQGPYSRVRHPLYVAEAIAMFGLVVELGTLPALLLFCAQSAVQIQRSKYEESVLKTAFPSYENYILKTDRFIPGVY
jgi:protein-S-isoprenylcysteine O-methyltransferase Ste14